MSIDWHEGERAMHARTGYTRADAARAGMIGDRIPEVAAQFARTQRLAVLATVDATGQPWASIVAGSPGMVEVPDDRHLFIEGAAIRDPAALDRIPAGRDAPAGVLLIEPATRRRMRLNGRARRSAEGLSVRAEEVYSNCPKYIRPRTSGAALVQDAAGAVPVSASLSASQSAWIRDADTCFLASHHPRGGADASHRGGPTGFIQVEAPNRIALPDYSGNFLFQTLGNLYVDPRLGLLVLDFTEGHVLHISARARINDDPARRDAFPDALRVIELDIQEVVERRALLPFAWTA